MREILIRAAERTRTPLVFVSNHHLGLAPSPMVRTLRVGAGFDVADERIAAEVCAGDLVITADVPLAAAVVERGAGALNPRGQIYDSENVAELLSLRNMMSELRDQGAVRGGPPPPGARERQRFANELDRWLARRP